MTRKTCTKESPCPNPPPQGEQWAHPDAFEIAEDYGSLADGGSYIQYRCPNCSIEFWVNLPD